MKSVGTKCTCTKAVYFCKIRLGCFHTNQQFKQRTIAKVLVIVVHTTAITITTEEQYHCNHFEIFFFPADK